MVREEEALLRALVPARREDDSALHEGAPTRSASIRDRRYRRALVAADLLAAGLAGAVAFSMPASPALTLTWALVLPLIVLVSKAQGLYDRDDLLVRKTTADEAPRLFNCATLWTLAAWLLDEELGAGLMAPSHVVALWVGLFGLGLAFRFGARAAVLHFTPHERCVFIGPEDAYERLEAKLSHPGVRAELVAHMTLRRPTGEAAGFSQPARQLGELIRWTDADRVIIDPQVLAGRDMLDLVRGAKAVGVNVSLLPSVLDVVGGSAVFDEIHGMTLLGIRRFGLTRSSYLLKRMFDLAGAGLGMLAIAPLLAGIAVAVRLDSRGPILFRQTRIGRNGRPFTMLKFRTMVDGADAMKAELRAHNEVSGGLFKIAEDPRITRVGRLLRKTSLDELPQLLNVLRGDMSLVGPRPLVVDEDALVRGLDRRRLHLTPGMTGPWQVLGSANVPLPEMVKIDYVYIAGWSLWSDVKTILRTVPAVLGRRGL